MEQFNEKEILKIIQELCRDRKQSELARKTGFTSQYIGLVVRGKRKPSDELLRKIGFERKTYIVEAAK